MKRSIVWFFLLFALICLGSCGKKFIPDELGDVENGYITGFEPSFKVVEGDPEIDIDIPYPTSISATKGESATSVTVQWSKVVVGGVDATYLVYRQEVGGELIRLTQLDMPLTGTSFIDVLGDDDLYDLQPGRQYHYFIKSVFDKGDANKTSMLSYSVVGYVLTRPLGLTASFREYENRIILNWDEALGAKFYMVARLDAPDETPSMDTNVLNRAWLSTEYIDWSLADGGDREPGRNYYYKIRAHYSSIVYTEWSEAVSGSILAPGVPGKVRGLDISKGKRAERIELSWINDPTASAYEIFRNEDPTAPFSGEPYASVSTNSFLDVDVKPGVAYYYRIAGINDAGPGALSDYDVQVHRGYALSAPAEFAGVYAILDAECVALAWTKPLGGEKYLIWKSGPYDQPIADYSAKDDLGNFTSEFALGWEVLGSEYVLSTSLVDESVNVADGKYYYYKIIPLAANYPEYSTESIDSAETDEFLDWKGLKNIAEVRTEKMMPFSGSISATKKNSKYLEDINLTVNLEGPTLIAEKFYNFFEVQIVKTSGYGYEDGVDVYVGPSAGVDGKLAVMNPMRFPTDDIIVGNFPKKGVPSKVYTEIIPITRAMLLAKNFEYLDDLVDYNADESKITDPEYPIFSYRWWDREAWKDIVRQKAFDMNRAVKSNYELVVRWKNGDSSWDSLSVSDQGWPALSDISFANLGFFLRECAFNRMWGLIWPPHYGDFDSTPYLLTNPTQLDGEVSGYLGFTASFTMSPLGGAGEGWIIDYSDWEGFLLNIDTPDNKFDLSVVLGENSRITIPLRFETPIYSGTLLASIDLYEGIYQRGTKGGFVEIRQEGSSIIRFPHTICNTYRTKSGDKNFYTTINFGRRIEQWPTMPQYEGGKGTGYKSNMHIYYGFDPSKKSFYNG
ncbi:MAG: hypothetical protein JXR63_13460 [Spirochaetales bacterium]|nr:hypothetical protein [Spirochaetales bacterium]